MSWTVSRFIRFYIFFLISDIVLGWNTYIKRAFLYIFVIWVSIKNSSIFPIIGKVTRTDRLRLEYSKWHFQTSSLYFGLQRLASFKIRVWHVIFNKIFCRNLIFCLLNFPTLIKTSTKKGFLLVKMLGKHQSFRLATQTFLKSQHRQNDVLANMKM